MWASGVHQSEEATALHIPPQAKENDRGTQDGLAHPRQMASRPGRQQSAYGIPLLSCAGGSEGRRASTASSTTEDVG